MCYEATAVKTLSAGRTGKLMYYGIQNDCRIVCPCRRAFKLLPVSTISLLQDAEADDRL